MLSLDVAQICNIFFAQTGNGEPDIKKTLIVLNNLWDGYLYQVKATHMEATEISVKQFSLYTESIFLQ